MNLEQHVKLLGFKCKDKVTAFEGVIDSVSFDLYGCIVASVKPQKLNKDGEIQDGAWFDITRLTIKGKSPVVPSPRFDLGYVADGKKGAAQKPTIKA